MQLQSKQFLGYSVQIDPAGQNFIIRNEKNEIVRTISVDELLARLIEPPVHPDLRRSDPRVDAALRLKYKEPNGVLVEGLTGTIGGGGLFIETQSPCPVGSVLELEVGIPFHGNSPIHAAGEVVWIRPRMERAVKFPGMGIKFSKVSSKDKERLLEFLQIFTKRHR